MPKPDDTPNGQGSTQSQGQGASDQQGQGQGTQAAQGATDQSQQGQGTQSQQGGQSQETQTQQDAAQKGWGDDWRKQYAGEDSKKLKQLERYQSPKAVIDALFAAQSKISSGEFKTALKENATPEEIAAWRKDNGVPEKPDQYAVDLGGGRVFGEADVPILASFLDAAHKANLPQSMVTPMLSWYHQHQEVMNDLQDKADSEFKAVSEDKLRVEWGADFRRNTQLALSLFESAPESLKENLMFARLADGTPLTTNPEALNWLVTMARELNPVSTLLPSGSGSVESAQSRIAELTKMSGDPESAYWKGPEKEKLQAEMRSLITAVEKVNKRN